MLAGHYSQEGNTVKSGISQVFIRWANVGGMHRLPRHDLQPRTVEPENRRTLDADKNREPKLVLSVSKGTEEPWTRTDADERGQKPRTGDRELPRGHPTAKKAICNLQSAM